MVLPGDVLGNQRPFVAERVVQFHQGLLLLSTPLHSPSFCRYVVLVPASPSAYLSRHCLALFRGKPSSPASRLATADQLTSPSSRNLRRAWSSSALQMRFSVVIMTNECNQRPVISRWVSHILLFSYFPARHSVSIEGSPCTLGRRMRVMGSWRSQLAARL